MEERQWENKVEVINLNQNFCTNKDINGVLVIKNKDLNKLNSMPPSTQGINLDSTELLIFLIFLLIHVSYGLEMATCCLQIFLGGKI